jgi:hypothetical protein
VFALVFGRCSGFNDLFGETPSHHRRIVAGPANEDVAAVSAAPDAGPARAAVVERTTMEARAPNLTPTEGRQRAGNDGSTHGQAMPFLVPAPPRQRVRQDPRTLLVAVANALLHMPIVGNIVAWFGFIPASGYCLDAACAKDVNIAMLPGGISEMTAYCGPDVERLVLRRRTGFGECDDDHCHIPPVV